MEIEKMSTNISVTFFLRKSSRKKDLHKVAGRIFNRRKKSEFTTDLFADKNDWNEKFCRSNSDKELNQKINTIEAKIFKIKEQLIIEGYDICSKHIKDILIGANKVQYGIVEFIERYIENKKDDTSLSRTYLFKYKRLKALVADFILKKYHVSDLMLPRVDYAFITSFNDYLKAQISTQYNRPLSPTTIFKRHTFFRTVLIQAYKEGYINKQPYINFKLRKVKTDIKYLTKEELTRIEKLELLENSTLQKVCDIFLFSVYTGLRFRDAQRITIHDIDNSSASSSFIITKQQKTGEMVEIPVIKPTQMLIDKYNDYKDRIEKGKLIPNMSNYKVNSYLKIIGELANIKLKLTHHVARHTCATTVLLENSVPMVQVSKWLGHAHISSTQVYGKITKSRLDTTARRINELY